MSDIDEQVAAFAAELDGAGVTDMDQVAREVGALATAILDAPTHELAAVAIREWFDLHPDNRDYALTVATSATATLGAHVALSPPVRLLGDDGLLRRVLRVSYAMTPYTVA